MIFFHIWITNSPQGEFVSFFLSWLFTFFKIPTTRLQAFQAQMEKLEAEIKVLNGKKQALFTSCGNVLEYSKKITKKDKQSLLQFKVKLESLDLVRDSFIDTIERLNILEAEHDAAFEVDFSPVNNFLEMYGLIKAAYVELNNLVNPPLPPPSVAPSSSVGQASNIVIPPVIPTPKVKLPTLDLPMFTGENAAEWVVFHELFKTMIHERNDLSNAQKCQYLLSKVSGKALSCCSLPATPENYPIIWQSLIDRYNDKRNLCCNYIESLLNFKSAKSESVGTLNNFVEKFGTTVSALKALALDNLDDIIIVHLAANKLCPDTVKLFERTLEKDEMPTFDKLIAFVKDQSRILSRVQPTPSGPLSIVSPSKPPVQKPRLSHNFLVTDSSNTPSEECVVCKKSIHPLFRCDKFHSLSPRDRYDIVRSGGRCLNCLATNHGVKNCPSKHVCSKCSKKHHSLLHFPVINITPPPLNRSHNQNSGSSKEPSTTCAVSTCSLVGRNDDNSSKTVLLSTVQVLIEDKQGDKHLARFLLDSGSQANFVTQKLLKN